MAPDANSIELLYDLINDPYELENLAGDVSFVSIMESLSRRLAELKVE